LAILHLAFNLQKPTAARRALEFKEDAFFISRQEDKDGLYEEIFLDQPVTYDDMLAAYLFAKTVQPHVLEVEEFDVDSMFNNNFLHTVALSKILLRKYLIWKFKNEEININKFILDKHEKEKKLLIKVAQQTNYTTYYGILGFKEDEEIVGKRFDNFLSNPVKFDMVKEYFEEMTITDKEGTAIENASVTFPNEEK